MAAFAPGVVDAQAKQRDLTVRNVGVVDTKQGRILPSRDVVIRGGKIVSVRIAAKGPIGIGGAVVDGTGKYLVAAFADMHIHMEGERFVEKLIPGLALPEGTYRAEEVFLPYVANGVLTVQNMAGMPEHFEFRKAAATGQVAGRRMILSAMIDGSQPVWPAPFSRGIKGAEEGRQAVRWAKAVGYDRIKAYSKLTLPEFQAVASEAQAVGMPVDGHIPGRGLGETARYFHPNLRMVAHAEEFLYQAKEKSDREIDAFASLMRRNGTWLTPTLTLYRQILNQARDVQAVLARPEVAFVHPVTKLIWMPPGNPYLRFANPADIKRLEENLAYQQRLVRRFARRGVPLLAGTDSLVPGVVPGYALHDELEELVAAGLSPSEALDAATRAPAAFLKKEREFGRVAPGLAADLVLLDANPLANIRNSRAIAGVLLHGRWMPRAELDRKLQELRARQAEQASALAPFLQKGGR